MSAEAFRAAADELERAYNAGEEINVAWWWLRDRADEIEADPPASIFQPAGCTPIAGAAMVAAVEQCICNEPPVSRLVVCGAHPHAHLLNCPVCGSGEEGDCICAVAEAFAEAEWIASGRAIYEARWSEVTQMKKDHLKIKALPEAHEFMRGHAEDRCRPELCGGSKVDPCKAAAP